MRRLGAIFWSALAIGFSGAMIPGAMLAMVLSESLNGRFFGALGIVLGHVLLEAALVLALAYGAGRVLRQPIVSAIVGVVGGALLAYMGGSVVAAVLRDPAAMTPSNTAMALPAGPVAAGVLVSVSNPSWLMWWSAVGIGYVAIALQRGTAGLVSFYVGHTLADWLWYGAVATLVIGGRSILQGAVYVWVIGVCGALLFGFGLFFVSLGVRELRQMRVRVAAGA
ncbi:MAG: LysE family transporter [Anaerolineae bacterium]